MFERNFSTKIFPEAKSVVGYSIIEKTWDFPPNPFRATLYSKGKTIFLNDLLIAYGKHEKR